MTESNQHIASIYKQKIVTAKNKAYDFDMLSDTWRLNKDITIKLGWLKELSLQESYIDEIRTVLAHCAAKISATTVDNYSYALKRAGAILNINSLKINWPNYPDYTKASLKAVYLHGAKIGIERFIEFNEFTKEQSVSNKRKIYDPEKGAYSEFEYQSLKSSFQEKTEKQFSLLDVEKVLTPTELNQFATLVACQLMNALVRRPTQLVKMKWADILPVGVSFNNSYNDEISEPTFSDIERLHVRTFRGKDGQFREYAEKVSHTLIYELSSLIGLYKREYLKVFNQKLRNEDITLSKAELIEITTRCPLFFDMSLFSLKFESKNKLFKLITMKSDVFHKSDRALRTLIAEFSKNLGLKSDRVSSDKLRFTNNRIRHYVLSEGARQGLSAPYLAAIIGVTEQAVKEYIDLTFDSRLDIDSKFANNNVLNKFAKTPVSSTLRESEFMVKNEFEEEIGIQSNKNSCASCKAKLSAPMGCYPCDNFRPLLDADHHQYLERAERKYLLNQQSGSSESSLKKIKKTILYIKATIHACEALKFSKGALSNE